MAIHLHFFYPLCRPATLSPRDAPFTLPPPSFLGGAASYLCGAVPLPQGDALAEGSVKIHRHCKGHTQLVHARVAAPDGGAAHIHLAACEYGRVSKAEVTGSGQWRGTGSRAQQ